VLGLLGIADKAHENAAVGILVVLARRLWTLPGKIPQAAASLTRSAREDAARSAVGGGLHGIAVVAFDVLSTDGAIHRGIGVRFDRSNHRGR
jgi:hypothetical protein